MAWEFITKPVRSTNAIAWEWEWRSAADDGSRRVSSRTFASFPECVADARLHGFTGEADAGEAGTLFRNPEARFDWY
jgi:hypothetical protein